MKDEIIKRSIECLQKDGLRFSIDEVASSLKISKKTIYKYFATKEDLAIEMFRFHYQETLRRFEELKDDPSFEAIKERLTLCH